jgi:hypothetical protein
MWRVPVTHEERLAIAAAAPLISDAITAERRPQRGAELYTLGGPAAVIAATDESKSTADDQDDWSGGFDIHLGVYTSD